MVQTQDEGRKTEWVRTPVQKRETRALRMPYSLTYKVGHEMVQCSAKWLRGAREGKLKAINQLCQQIVVPGRALRLANGYVAKLRGGNCLDGPSIKFPSVTEANSTKLPTVMQFPFFLTCSPLELETRQIQSGRRRRVEGKVAAAACSPRCNNGCDCAPGSGVVETVPGKQG